MRLAKIFLQLQPGHRIRWRISEDWVTQVSATTETPDTEAYLYSIPDYAVYKRETVTTVWPPEPGMKAITVNVNWKDTKQIDHLHSVKLKTSLAR